MSRFESRERRSCDSGVGAARVEQVRLVLWYVAVGSLGCMTVLAVPGALSSPGERRSVLVLAALVFCLVVLVIAALLPRSTRPAPRRLGSRDRGR